MWWIVGVVAALAAGVLPMLVRARRRTADTLAEGRRKVEASLAQARLLADAFDDDDAATQIEQAELLAAGARTGAAVSEAGRLAEAVVARLSRQQRR